MHPKRPRLVAVLLAESHKRPNPISALALMLEALDTALTSPDPIAGVESQFTMTKLHKQLISILREG